MGWFKSSLLLSHYSATLEFVFGFVAFVLAVIDFRDKETSRTRAWTELIVALGLFVAASFTLRATSLYESEKQEDDQRFSQMSNNWVVAGNELAQVTNTTAQIAAKLTPRRITQGQFDRFKQSTDDIQPKLPIKLVLFTTGVEEATFASDLRRMFAYAGFPTNSDADDRGLNFLPLSIAMNPGTTNEHFDLIRVDGIAQNMIFISMKTLTNRVWRRPRCDGCPTNIVGMILEVSKELTNVDITSIHYSDPKLAKPDEAFFVVVPK
jgi:hypothetical protein